MNSDVRSFKLSPDLGLLLPALVVALGMQLLRLFIPNLVWYLRAAVGLSTFELVPYAFGTFFLAFLAGPLRRLAGGRGALWISAGGVAVARVAEALTTDPSMGLWLSIIGLGFFMVFPANFLGHLRALDGHGTSRWVHGLILGMAFDVTSRGIFGDMGTRTVRGALPTLVAIGLAGLILWAIWREPRPVGATSQEVHWRDAMLLLALGPYLLLQALFFSSGGYIEEVASLRAGLGFVIVLLGYAVAAIGVAWGLTRPHTFHPTLALGVTLFLTPMMYFADASGWLLLVTLLAGQSLMGWGWGAIARRNERVTGEGMARTSVILGVTMVLFVTLLFAFYAAQDIALPFSRAVIPAVAALMLGLAFLGASLRTRELTANGRLEGTSPALAGIFALVGFVTWGVVGGGTAHSSPPSGPIKVMSFNIQSGFSFDGRQDLESIAGVIAASGADVVAIQESSRGRLMDGSLDMPLWLAHRLDMDHRFRGTEEPNWGNTILSRYPILEAGWGHLPRVGTLIGRGYLWARLDIGEPEPLLVIATHLHQLGPDTLQRQAQVRSILDFWNETEPAILVGDMNAEPGSAEMALLAQAGMVDAWNEAGTGPGYTYSAGDPVKRIDWLWHTPDLRVEEIEVLRTQVSDHMPVVATVEHGG